MGSRGQKFVFIDGFAGPGEYEGGEDGSPLIFLKTAAGHRAFLARPPIQIIGLFSDIEQAVVDELDAHLRELESANSTPDWLVYETACGPFEDLADELLSDLDERGQRLAPTLLFLDPFGIKGVSFDVVKRVAANPSCEVLITFMYEAMNRFHSTNEFDPHMTAMFGTTDWKNVMKIKDPREREKALVELYRVQLEQQATLKYVRSFRMINERNRTEYYLIFGTNEPIGLSKMKEAMWKADPSGGAAFRDLDDPEQDFLFDLGDIKDLRTLLLKKFSGTGLQKIKAFQDFVLFQTDFCENKHLKTATLKPMEEEGLLYVDPTSRSRKGTFPDGTKLGIVGKRDAQAG